MPIAREEGGRGGGTSIDGGIGGPVAGKGGGQTMCSDFRPGMRPAAMWWSGGGCWKGGPWDCAGRGSGSGIGGGGDSLTACFPGTALLIVVGARTLRRFM